jgi:Nuclease-related domain/AAA domain
MAEYFGLGADEPDEHSEKLVANYLKSLPSPWIVLHHVSWQGIRDGRQGDGEADFILLHPQYGALVLEVKGGGIHLDKGRWYTTDRFGHVYAIKNPYEQATASKHALIDWLSGFKFGSKIRVGHAVVFPHHPQLPNLGPAATPTISLSLTELSKVETSVLRCVQHWKLTTNLSSVELKLLVAALAPTVEIRRKLFTASNQAEERILTLTAEQVAVFAGLRAVRGGLVLGGAGTGKTVLAVARAQQLARDGFRTLLVCFNDLLGEQLANSLKGTQDLIACTYHSLCMKEALRSKQSIPTILTEPWWEVEAPEVLVKAFSDRKDGFDAVVVDEGQDFSPLWLDSLRLIMRQDKKSPFFVFADSRQDIWKRRWREDEDFAFSWELTLNLRNTEPIARKVASIIGTDCIPTGMSGPKPRWRVPSDRNVSEGDVLDALQELIDEGFIPGSLVVLTTSSKTCGNLRERTVGSFSLGKWGGKGFAVETIRRFKGLESQAIVLVLETGEIEEMRLLAYVGASRARTVLSVVGSPQLRDAINWR